MSVTKFIYRFLFLFTLFAPVLLQAQPNADKTAEAHKAFEAQEYNKALALFGELSRANPNDPSVSFYYAATMVEAGKITDETFKRLTLAVNSEHFPDAKYYRGEAYRKTYRFDQAIAAFNDYLKSPNLTPVMEEKTTLQINACQNGKNMLDYVYEPKVVGRIKVPVKLMHLFYHGLDAGAFAEIPASMKMKVDSVNTSDYPSIAFFSKANTKNADVIYFSSYGLNDKTGLDIYCIRRIEGDKWGEPENLGAQINTPFDEDFPYITEDGNTLYFASKGHYSMGGYDIYRSRLDPVTKTWGEPENLGFPFSSPYDDVLFVPDSKGEYVYFASKRDSDPDEITLYKLQLEVNLLNTAVSDIDKIARIARLRPGEAEQVEEESVLPPSGKPELDANPTYKAMVKQAGLYNTRLAQGINELETLRQEWSRAGSDNERDAVAAKVLDKEKENGELRTRFESAIAQVNNAQYEYITNGVLPIDSALMVKVSRLEAEQHPSASIAETGGNVFGRQLRPLTPMPVIKMTQPQPEEENLYEFTTTLESKIFTNIPLPKGILYRIQIGTFAKPVPVENLKKLSPVFVETLKSGQSKYFVGYFETYKDAEKALAIVKQAGFKTAFVVAYFNGRVTALATVRAKETALAKAEGGSTAPATATTTTARTGQKASSSKEAYRVIIGTFSGPLPERITKAITETTNKDIVRTSVSGGKFMYSVGNFVSMGDANVLKTKLESEGLQGVQVETVTLK